MTTWFGELVNWWNGRTDWFLWGFLFLLALSIAAPLVCWYVVVHLLARKRWPIRARSPSPPDAQAQPPPGREGGPMKRPDSLPQRSGRGDMMSLALVIFFFGLVSFISSRPDTNGRVAGTCGLVIGGVLFLVYITLRAIGPR